jgi:hypothetical protein
MTAIARNHVMRHYSPTPVSAPRIGHRWALPVQACAWLVLAGAACTAAKAEPSVSPGGATTQYTSDGRSALPELMGRFDALAQTHGWLPDTIYTYPGSKELAIRSWRTPRRGAALWLLSGIHGEEPAGPNAISRNLPSLVALANSGVPVVLIPLCNPKAYRSNWRYPNTPERDWHKGGYSVGDAEHLLPDLANGSRPRAAAPPGPETKALTHYVLQLARDYPPVLVLDLHEDELSTQGGYIYSQGSHADENPVGAEIVRLLLANGIPLRKSGNTRFGEPIVDGVISRDDKGQPIRDGSIDELFAATEIYVDGKRIRGPAASTVIVVETPAFAGSRFEQRVAAQGAVVRNVRGLWRLAQDGRRKGP